MASTSADRPVADNSEQRSASAQEPSPERSEGGPGARARLVIDGDRLSRLGLDDVDVETDEASRRAPPPSPLPSGARRMHVQRCLLVGREIGGAPAHSPVTDCALGTRRRQALMREAWFPYSSDRASKRSESRPTGRSRALGPRARSGHRRCSETEASAEQGHDSRCRVGRPAGARRPAIGVLASAASVDETNIAFSDMSSAHGTAWHTAMTPRDPR
jgi:hypothetical protein